jgi:two-component system cell cycle sensor histidine kinase/response regulator CckA
MMLDERTPVQPRELSLSSTQQRPQPDSAVCDPQSYFTQEPRSDSGFRNVERRMPDFSGANPIEETLRGGEESYRRLAELSPDGIGVLSEGRLVFVNRAGARLIGALRAEELTRTPILDLVEPALRVHVETRLLQIEEGGPTLPLIEGKLLRLDGTVVDVEMAAAPFTYRGKPATQILFRDITQRKRAEGLRIELEEKLRQAERMEALGRLTGGVAHDFINHLSVIKGSVQFLLTGLAATDPLLADVERIDRAADRGTQLIRHLLMICRGEPAEPQLLDVASLVPDMVPMLRLLLGQQITLHVDLAPTLWAVRADPVQIDRVIMNLVTNARDAILSGGSKTRTVTVETANVEASPEASRRGGESGRPGQYVMLAVHDTGCGMTPEVRRRIFEPFFTSKEPGKGTGLGLATVADIVRRLRGFVACESEPGQGTTFRIYLPRDDSGVTAPAEEATTAVACNRPPQLLATMLMVEDAEGVREVVREALQELR